MISGILTLIHAYQSAFSAYNLYLSGVSVNNLMGYKDMSKKAAKHSSTAAGQLFKTRTTQASAVISMLLTFLTSTTQLLFLKNKWLNVLLSLINLGALEGGRRHVSDFWKGKKQIPLQGVGDFNEATKKTQEVKLNMEYLIVSWGVASFLGLFA